MPAKIPGMEASTLFIIIAIVTLAAIAALWFFQIRPHAALSPLAGLAFGLVIAGIVFGDDPRWLGYGLFAIGILVAFADMMVKQRGRRG